MLLLIATATIIERANTRIERDKEEDCKYFIFKETHMDTHTLKKKLQTKTLNKE